MQVWITKHWQSRGIYSVHGEPFGIVGSFQAEDGRIYRRTEWHTTLPAASERRTVLFNRKITRLEDELMQRLQRLHLQRYA